MSRRKKDVLDHLCSSMEIFMCGTDDYNKFRSRATGTAISKPSDDSSSSPAGEKQSSEATQSSVSDEIVAPKKVALVTPTNDDLEVERDPVSVSIRKASPGQPTHLELVSFYEKSGVYIKSIKPESKFHSTKIEAGMKIIRINGRKCPATVKETFEHMTATNDVLTVTAVVVESRYGEQDFMFKEIKLDDAEAKTLQTEEEKEEKAPSPTRVSTDWFGGYLGKKGGSDGQQKVEASRNERKERIKNVKKTGLATERDRIGLGFADRVLRDLGVLEPDGEDNDSLDTYERDDTTYRSAPTLDDATYQSAPTVDDTYNGAPAPDDDDFTLSTAGGTTIVDSTPIIAKIYKKTKKDNLGLHFVSFKKKRGIYVYRIHEESRFLSTKLEPGMKLLAINGQPCPPTVAETLALVQNIQGDLSIKAHHPSFEDVKAPKAAKNVTSQQKVDDLTEAQEPAVSIDRQQSTSTEEKESKEDGQPEQVQKSMTDVTEANKKGDEKKLDEAEKIDDKEDEEEASTYESLPPPKNEP